VRGWSIMWSSWNGGDLAYAAASWVAAYQEDATP